MRRATFNGGILAAAAAGLLIGTEAFAQQFNRNQGGVNLRGRVNVAPGNRGNQQGARINGRVNAGNRGNGNLGIGVRAGGNRFNNNGRRGRGFRGNRFGRGGVGVGVFLGGGRGYYGSRGYGGYYSNNSYYPGNAYSGSYGHGGSYYSGSGHAGYSSGPCASGVGHQGYVQNNGHQGYSETGERYEAARPAFGGRLAANRPGFGVSFDDRADGVVRISHVYPNSPAARAGILVGDIVTGLNGQQVRADWQGTVTRIRGMNPGDELDLTIQRDGEEQQLNAELATWDEAFAARKGRTQNDETAPAPSASDAVRDNANPIDPEESADPLTPDKPIQNDDTATPDKPGLDDTPVNPAEPNLNDTNDQPGADLDTKTPDVKPKDPTLPELPQADTPDSATETNDLPKQE